jgi:hypothetical protein
MANSFPSKTNQHAAPQHARGCFSAGCHQYFIFFIHLFTTFSEGIYSFLSQIGPVHLKRGGTIRSRTNSK